MILPVTKEQLDEMEQQPLTKAELARLRREFKKQATFYADGLGVTIECRENDGPGTR